ncbi:MAG: glycosyltransferase [Acidobacteriaceae bacterium]|nr:glycosyltransferase [Acidobacteriaceae bacterium]
MTNKPRSYVFLGLSITSAWGNGHATTYRGLLKELARLGHSVTFLERDVPWYAANREFCELPYCTIHLYESLDDLESRFAHMVRSADAVVVGSYIPEGIAAGRWVQSTARGLKVFYDIDTPVTLSNIENGSCEYLSADLIPGYDLYFSFTGGPMLKLIERKLRSPRARALYCSVDPALYFPQVVSERWDLAYLGTYAADRQPALQKLLLNVAQTQPEFSFAVAGPQYPGDIAWPENVERIDHLPAAQHRAFYNAQHFTLNITRRDMRRAGYSPSVRLFEAAACGVPILTDTWPGISDFFEPGSEILPVSNAVEVARCLRMPLEQRRAIAQRARARTLKHHTAAVRAEQFSRDVDVSFERLSRSNKRSTVVVTEPASALS